MWLNKKENEKDFDTSEDFCVEGQLMSFGEA